MAPPRCIARSCIAPVDPPRPAALAVQAMVPAPEPNAPTLSPQHDSVRSAPRPVASALTRPTGSPLLTAVETSPDPLPQSSRPPRYVLYEHHPQSRIPSQAAARRDESFRWRSFRLPAPASAPPRILRSQPV